MGWYCIDWVILCEKGNGCYVYDFKIIGNKDFFVGFVGVNYRVVNGVWRVYEVGDYRWFLGFESYF